jgi:hypothetical protein
VASSDALKIAFFVILFLALIIAIYGHYTAPPPPPPPPPQPQLVTNQPAGLAYNGPGTTALAGYYCIESINSSNGYSIQLNALLSNGLWVQNMYGPWLSNGQLTQPYYGSNVWANKTLLHTGATQYINAPCAWMVITINDGTVYFGYSLDGKNIVWYDSYPVGDAVIEPVVSTELVLGGYGNGAQAVLGNGTTLVYLALYYWNGTTWAPAPVGVLPIYTVGRSYTITAESVNNAYVFTGGTCGGVVSWPNPVNETICPSSPSFKP